MRSVNHIMFNLIHLYTHTHLKLNQTIQTLNQSLLQCLIKGASLPPAHVFRLHTRATDPAVRLRFPTICIFWKSDGSGSRFVRCIPKSGLSCELIKDIYIYV